MKGSFTKSAIAWSVATAALTTSNALHSQESARQTQAVEEVVVTGTYIKRKSQLDTSTPLRTYGQDEFSAAGIKDARDLIQSLTINAGSQNNADNLTQNFTAGTSNINLRGLGVSQTLVLLNGKRQVVSSVVTDQGSSFVDTASLLPNLAIERVEILKDGASAIYGSDAVAGVANFITRDTLDGTELQIERRSRSGNGSQDDTNIDFAYGGDLGETGHVLFAASYLDRTSLLLGEVDFLRPATSGFGNPGSYTLSSTGETVPDPNCVENGGIDGGAFCRFDFGPQVTAVPEEERLQAFARSTWDWDETTQVWAEFGYARNKVTREVSPSFPALSTPTVLASHPDNPFGEDVTFLGRPYGVGQPTELNFYEHTTTRFAIGAEGEVSDSVSWNFSFVRAANDAILNPRDVIASNFQAALNGFGGINCDPTTTAAGEGECLYFNPFSIDDPDNDALRDFIIGDYLGDTESELDAIEFIVSGNDLFELPGGSAGFAIGAQYRDESVSAVYDSITQQDGFSFLIGNQNFSGSRDVYGIFGELLLPVSDTVEISAALRYEDYGGSVGDTTNPKLSVLWAATDSLSFRFSGSSSFRAPSVHQLQGAQTNFANISDPNNNGESTFGGNRTLGNPDLAPEESNAFNLGASYQLGAWNIDLDYWDFSFEDVLTRESLVDVVNADPNDPERVVRTSAGTIAIVNTQFINAESIDTSGIDLALKATYDTNLGTFSPIFDATYVLDYEFTSGGVTRDGAGALNFNTVGNPTPELRANLGLSWSRGIHNANVFVRHVSSYDDNRDPENIESIDSFNTLDLQYSVDLGELIRSDSSTALTFGVINATGENPPFVDVAGSYDSRTGDPRGRRIYVKAAFSF